MTPSIDLVLVGTERTRPQWTHGAVRSARPTAASIATALDEASSSDAVLVIDCEFPLPDEALLDRLLHGPADVWHGGLDLGLGHEPTMLDHVAPVWMLNRAADPGIEATSWRLSFRALLVRRGVLSQLGGPLPDMETPTGAALELGFRWARAGALVRHVPGLVPSGAAPDPAPTPNDSIRVVTRHYGQKWGLWTLPHAVLRRQVGVRSALHAAEAVLRTAPASIEPYAARPRNDGDIARSVSVVIPTIDRYPYLDPLLRQLRRQTVPPYEVLLVDQTPLERRRDDLTSMGAGLNTVVFQLDSPGQSTARNTALVEARGEMVLFIDDDDEIPPDLLEQHLRRLVDGIDASCGGVDDATAGPPPPGFRHRRVSDVFPTNNTMLRRDALVSSGLFDPAYDHGPRADHDLGMRLYLSGALLVYDPEVLVFHHHAPMGGLRTHGARAVTRAGSRRSIVVRAIPSATEIYFAKRYFSRAQARQAVLVQVISILAGEGSRPRKVARFVLQFGLLPSTIRRVQASSTKADELLRRHVPLPRLDPAATPPSEVR